MKKKILAVLSLFSFSFLLFGSTSFAYSHTYTSSYSMIYGVLSSSTFKLTEGHTVKFTTTPDKYNQANGTDKLWVHLEQNDGWLGWVSTAQGWNWANQPDSCTVTVPYSDTFNFYLENPTHVRKYSGAIKFEY